MADFITSASFKFFERFDLPFDFLATPPSSWTDHAQYKYCLKAVSKLKSVNVVAKRGVKLMEDYQIKLTKNKEERQFIIRTVRDYRRINRDVKKLT